MVLASRGWTPEAFRLAAPDFMDAARFAVFAERAVPILQDQERVQAIDMTDLAPKARLDVAKAKMNAAEVIRTFRAALYPEDSDG